MTPGMEPTEYDQLRALLSPIHATPQPEEAPVTDTINNWTTVDTSTEDTTPETPADNFYLQIETARTEGYDKGVAVGRAESNEQASLARREGYRAGMEEGKRQGRDSMRTNIIQWWKDYAPFGLEDLNDLLNELGLEKHRPIEQVIVTVKITVDTSDMNVSNLDDFNFDVDKMKARVYTDTGEAWASEHDVEFEHIEDVSWH